ncbi:MAG: hypothetical protein ACLGJC_28340 [Alphaproteobacteria bacterium]
MTIIRDHLCALFLPLTLRDRSADDVRANLVAPLTTHPAAGLARLFGCAAVPAWSEEKKAGKGPERGHDQLTAAARGVLYGDRRDGPPHGRFRGMPPLCLTPAMLGAWRLAIRLPKEGGDVALTLAAGRLHLFGTGTALVRLDIRVTEPGLTLEGLKAVLYQLGRLNLKSTRACLLCPAGADAGAPIGLRALLDALTVGLTTGDSPALEPIADQRLFIYSGIFLDTPLADDRERRLAAYRVSRATSPHEIPPDEELAEGFLAMGNGNHHAASQEGGAILREPREKKPAAKEEESNENYNFLADRFVPLYVPLAALAYQEYLTLLRLGDDSRTVVDFDHPDQQAYRQLKSRNNDILDLRLNHRFSHVSHMTRVNRVYAAWRSALALDARLEELTRDVTEVTAYLTQRREDDEAHRRATVSHTQTLLGLGYGALVLLTGVYGMNFPPFNTPEGAQMDKSMFTLPVLLAEVGILCAVIWVARALAPKRLDED